MTTDLKLDFDNARFPTDFMDRLGLLSRLHSLHVEAIAYNRTVRGWHVRVRVRGRVGFLRCVALQSILGSDWKREAFNSRRALAWRTTPKFWRERANVLYRRHSRSVPRA